MELPGASLNIIGVFNDNATPEEAKQLQSSDMFFASEFYKNILIPSTEGLPLESKTRSNNLVTIYLQTFQYTFSLLQNIWRRSSSSFKQHRNPVCGTLPPHNIPILIPILQVWTDDSKEGLLCHIVTEKEIMKENERLKKEVKQLKARLKKTRRSKTPAETPEETSGPAKIPVPAKERPKASC